MDPENNARDFVIETIVLVNKIKTLASIK